jgi:RNA polymerase-binding transcription factor DksA
MLRKINDQLFLIKQKNALNKEKKRVEKELAIIEKFPSYGDKEEENAMEVEAFEGYLGLRTGARNLRDQIQKALLKLDKGTYLKCDVCKSPIEKGRLDAFPAATTCVGCSNKQIN